MSRLRLWLRRWNPIRRWRSARDWKSLVANAVEVVGADPTGERDSTAAIQEAIDKACLTQTVLPSGKHASLVKLPAGTYSVRTLNMRLDS